MRKIESQMNEAIQSDKNWHGSNTMVKHDHGVSFVFLHGNLIAEIGDDWLKLYDGGWQTVTTKSRLNAILAEFGATGERVFQKAGEWFVTLSGVDGLYTTEFRSGMRLA